mmetsp:Transcript_5305/g.10126  ORF Transcript_5305/g.10126 Transcript_5305/m.10126 type:complete len:206 (+) Transcript_5305:1085-1702(+)
MKELVKGVLPIGTWLPKVNLTSLHRQRISLDIYALSIALHGHLLDVRRQLRQGLSVRQDRARRVPQKGNVPHREQSQNHGKVGAERRSAKVLVHRPGPLKEALHMAVSVLQGERQNSNCTGDAETATHPVPESERVLLVDPEFLHQLQVGAYRHHVLRHSGRFCRTLPELGHEPVPYGARVQHRLSGGEGFRHNHHQGGLGIQAL